MPPEDRWVRWIALGGGAFVAVLLLAMGFARGPGFDGATYAVVGEAVAAGQAPYRDVWDQKPPGIYLAHAVATTLLPNLGGWSIAWLLTVASTLLTITLSVFLVGREARGPGIALGVGSAALVLGSTWFSDGGGDTESLAVLPASAAVAVLIRWPGSVRSATIAGVLAAVAVVISLQAVAVAPAVGWLILSSRRPAAIGGVIVGSVSVIAAVGGWVWGIGALPAAREIFLEFGPAYVASAGLLRPGTLTRILVSLLVAAPLVVGLALAARSRIRPSTSPLAFASVLWIVTWLVLIIAQQNFFPHYALVIVPPLAVLAGRATQSWTAGGGRNLTRITLAIAVGVSLAVTALTEPGPAAPSRDQLVTRAITGGVGPTSLVIWGNEPGLYLDPGVRRVTRYPFLYPLTVAGFATPEMVAIELADWEEDPPEVIIDASWNPGRVGFHPLLGPWRYPGPPPADLLDPLREFVATHYAVDAHIDAWTIYRLIEEPRAQDPAGS